MNILDSILSAGNGAAVSQIGSQVGLDDAQTAAALSALVPALSAGLRQNLQTPDGLSGLGHILGSKDVSRRVAADAGAQTGLSPDILKRMLPLVATLVMGAMSRQSAAGGATPLSPGSGGGLLEMLGGALDSNRDGSPLDDITGMLGRAFGRG